MRQRIALLGCGTVGTAVLTALATSPIGEHLDVVGIAVRDLSRPRDRVVPTTLLTDDPLALSAREDVDVVVEAMGGTTIARIALEVALGLGKDVVTANKAVVAAHGVEFARLADARGASLSYEAAAGASVPVVAFLRSVAKVDPVRRIDAVLNGTSNYVLSRLEQGADWPDAIAEAQAAGYAEADPSRDLDGSDAADKLVLLSRLAFGLPVTTQDVWTTGIARLDPDEVRSARAAGKRWKLVASATPECLKVEPLLVAEDDPLARVDGADNLARVQLTHGGTVSLHGAGAGGGPTASAILRDLARLVRTPVAC